MFLLKPLRLMFLVTGILVSQSALANFDHGEFWNQMSEDMRTFWVMGVINGQEIVMESLPDSVSIEASVKIERPTKDAIANLMTQYYADPANTFIPWNNMVVLANEKLGGKSEQYLAEKISKLRAYGKWLQEKSE